jgi:hypothetical protein
MRLTTERMTQLVAALLLFTVASCSDPPPTGPDSSPLLQSAQRLFVEVEDIAVETSPDGSAVLFTVTLSEDGFSSTHGPQDRIAVTVTGTSGETIETLLLPRFCPELSLGCSRISVYPNSLEAQQTLRARAGELPGLWEDRGPLCAANGLCYDVGRPSGMIWLLGPEPLDVLSAFDIVRAWPGVEFALLPMYSRPVPGFSPLVVENGEFHGGLLLESANLGDSILVEYEQPDGSRLVVSHSL